MRLSPGLMILAFTLTGAAGAQQPMPATPLETTGVGRDQTAATKVAENIYQAIGFGNTFLVTTPAGNVIIDTSIAFNAALHTKLLRAVSAAPIKYIVLTHAHGDHTGGIAAWRKFGAPDLKIIAQREHVDFQHYQTRLKGFYDLRNAAQFGRPPPSGSGGGESPGNYAAKIEPTIVFDDEYEFTLAGVQFKVLSTPGETYDHATVWLPQQRAAFVGDNYYESFPNIYTLRGTQPRWALDYVDSLNEVLALKPEIVLPSHGAAIQGNAEVTRRLTRYRDAIKYVHDETVRGMNAGKDVWTLMREIRLPAALDVGESYGKLSWSIRGIYEGYVGWFDLQPATMYETPASAVYADVAKLAGGPDAIAKLARERVAGGRSVEALHLSDIALAARPDHRGALEAKLAALERLRQECRNSNERGWLDYSIGVVNERLTQIRAAAPDRAGG
jgi:alkyl sulfatase BDS1-like metallo-beta-lactamase superfamily hydrolase